MSALSRETELAEMSPQTKKLWRAESAAEVIGPVDRGDRMMEKKGARRVCNDKYSMSVTTYRLSRRYRDN
jgi:hypothetical protein